MDMIEPEQLPPRFVSSATVFGEAQTALMPAWSSLASSGRLSLPTLPTPLTPLVDREQAVTTVCTRLTHPEVRLLTLTGAGGVGKTRLALAVARAVQTSFADGVCFVNLSTVHDPEQVLPTLAQALGLHMRTDSLFKALQAALYQRQLLLLLDNVEQVVEAAPQLAELLVACPRVRLLATSREPLHVEGEHEFLVPPLPLPTGPHPEELEELEANPAVTLFVQRAQALQPAFQLTKANAAIITAICVRLEGIPLALELAAARVKLFSPKALLAHLDHPLQFLVTGSRSAPPRQQTLRRTISWSYALLSSEEQRLFRRLCVFEGGWTLAAAEAIMATLSETPTDVKAGLGALLNKNLILLENEGDTERRFQMLETIRAFGLECLEASGEEEQVRQAHSRYYLRWVEAGRRELFSSKQALLIRWYIQEQWNWRAVMHFLLDQHDTQAALVLAGGLSFFLLAWGYGVDQRYLLEGRDFLEQALSADQEDTSPARVRAHSLLGSILGYLGEFEHGAALCRSALATARVHGNAQSILVSLWMYCGLLITWDDLPAARVADEEALTLSQIAITNPTNQFEDRLMRALTLRRVGYVALWQGRYAQAREQFGEGMTICARQDEQYVLLWFQLLLGEVDFFEGRDEEARERLEQVIHLYQLLGVRTMVAEALGFLGLLSLRQDDMEGACMHLLENIRLREAIGDARGLAWAQIWLARAELAQRKLDGATRLLFEGLARALQTQSRLLIAMGLEELGKVATEQGEPTWAARLFGAAQALREAIEAPLPPCEQPAYEQVLSSIREQLGTVHFHAAWAQGHGMAPQQVLESRHEAVPMPALSSLPTSTPSPASSPVLEKEAGSLTRREQDVLRLLAQGRTNVQIAERLVVSPLTVKAHVRAIYQKLGVKSRAAATRFALDHHLL